MNADLRAAQAATELRVRCLLAGDVAGMAPLLDEALVYVHSPGQVQGKTQLLQFLMQELHVLSIERQPRMQIMHDGLVLLAFEQHMHAKRVRAGAAVFEAHSYFAEVWRLTDGAWRMLHAQSTALTPLPID